MAQDIKKSIAEGWGKGELYAALHYDEDDAFGGMKIGPIRIQGQLKVHNRPLTTNVFAVEIKADVKNSTGTYTGALQCVTRSYPTTDTTAVTVSSGYFSTELHSGDTMTAGYLIGIYSQAVNQGTCNGAGIMITPQWNLITDNGVYTSISHMNALWLDSHLTKTITSGNLEFLYITNNGTSTFDNAIYIYGSNAITNLLAINTCSGMVSADIGATAIHKTVCKSIKIDLDGTTFYLLASTAPAAS